MSKAELITEEEILELERKLMEELYNLIKEK